ncbi:DUF7668 domain-containing protein [Spirillospora albida]|uniref:DUF7668 domain-containing protein n=1 Tax=Spirillospora albida TaxID=58123 RepID=UPI000A884515|nr:hypothetical protein [Spirillospora albida]
MVPEEGVRALRVVVGLLVRGDFEELETLTEARTLTAARMAAVIEASGRRPITPPDEAFRDDLATMEVEAAEPDERAYRVDFPLWTVREGRGGLLLSVTLTEVMDGVWTVGLDGLDIP